MKACSVCKIEKDETCFYQHRTYGTCKTCINDLRRSRAVRKNDGYVFSNEWKQVPNFPDYYVTICGRIRSAKRMPHKDMKPTINMQGYHQLGLFLSDKGKHYRTGLHRMVALAWVPNPNNYPCVHHIDHNKANNHASNLEWVTYSQNMKYNYTTGGQIGKTNMKGLFLEKNPNSKWVHQYSLGGEYIQSFKGATTAADCFGIDVSHIVKVCRGKLKKTGGYKWSY
jgi:hypothetical protein